MATDFGSQSFYLSVDKALTPFQFICMLKVPKENKSLAIAKDNQIITYGNSHARERLLQDIHSWVDLGMPGATCFKLQIYPIDFPVTVKGDRWIVQRKESQFVWQLDLI